VIALPIRRQVQLELYLEVDLTTIAISADNQEEEETNLKFTGLKFTHRVRSQEREVNQEEEETNLKFTGLKFTHRVRSQEREVNGDRPVRLDYQPPASNTFLSEQTSHQESANNTFLSEQSSTSYQPPAKRTGCKLK
jgi:hypothetical protein